jgi:uncharacterized protein Usg
MVAHGDDARPTMKLLSHPAFGYRLTTAEILYHLPDHPHLLQTFIWQQMDLAPDFPVLRKFLDFWAHNLDGTLHSVKVAHAAPAARGRLRHAAHSFALH